MNPFARVRNGHEYWSAHARVPRHKHDQAYAAIVLSGFYEECGSLGRFRAGPGDVLLHGRFEGHLDRFGSAGARILNLIIPDSAALPRCIGRIRDADSVARVAESDPAAAFALLREQLSPVSVAPGDWPDMLAADLLANPELSLGGWAYRHGLASETLSRGFRKVFAVTPAAFRTEARARKAFVQIAENVEPLAAVAALSGFSDQAHMSRATRALTGKPPGWWRDRSNWFKTEAARPV
ncbi:MAG TPA: AraC family transcriptional regulator [Rhizomicrobium sp.]|jgi:AraC-like DNA-binding protein